MPNGSGLTGSNTGGQNAVIIPIPCNTTRYVIFHVTDFSNPGYLSYTVVDMSLNGGLGDVDTTNKNVSLGTGWTEKLCAYYNPSGKFYWLLTHQWNSDAFVAFKVDATTIAATSVTTSIGSVHNCGTYGGAHDAMGQLTISPDGSKVINALTCTDKFELFDFNINTGVLSNSISIPGNSNKAWGTAFSPDNKKVYVDDLFGQSVYQYDISTYTQSSILASKTTLYTSGTAGYNFGYMELGPDNKVYIAYPNKTWVSAVNNPNNAGAACTFSLNGLSLGNKNCQWGLSRIAYNIPSPSQGNLNVSTSTKNVSCFGYANGSATVSVLPAGTYSYNWTPGSYSTAVVSNLAPGNYSVTATDGCFTSTTSLIVTQPSSLSLNVTPSSTICNGNTATISSTVSGGTPAYTYSWSNGSPFSGIIVNPAVTTSYTLDITDANGCTIAAMTTVNVSNCQGIHEIQANLNVAVYPNPVTDILHITFPGQLKKLQIINLLGEVKNDLNPELREADVSNLAAGVYFLKLTDKSNYTEIIRFVRN